MKDGLKNEILEDFIRANDALVSAKRNFEEGDILTSANRVFVACENAIYAHLKLKFGSTTFSRNCILRMQKLLATAQLRCAEINS